MLFHRTAVRVTAFALCAALAAMLLKYAETVLALRHRRLDGAGEYHGGAMYYIKEAFRSWGKPAAGAVIAAIFALLCIVNALSMGTAVNFAFGGNVCHLFSKETSINLEA